MNSASRACIWTKSLVVVLTVAIVLVSFPGYVANATGTRVYVGHRARLSAQIPVSWTVPSDGRADYAGEDGFVVSASIPGNDLQDACDNATQSWNWGDIRSRLEREHGEDTCLLEGQLNGRELRGVVLVHPAPFNVSGQTFGFVELIADPDHFDAIRSSVSFDPADVTPQLYAESVLDIIEARAWYAPDVDWDLVRDGPLGMLENAESYDDVHWVIRQALQRLRDWGDNHSFFVSYDQTLEDRVLPDTGMILQGRVVYLVFPDGPAGRAGIQTGDTIEAVNGERFNGTRWIEELVGLGATLTVSRHGEAAPFEVEVIPGSFSPYLKPIATPIDDVGYVELFTDVGADQIQYATDANDGIARIQDDVACGWILDLRRNGGGGYFSMTIGTEALLQDGNLLSFVRRDGTVAGRVDLHAGSMYQDGLELTGNLDDVPRADRVAPGTPIAVLIGPATASAAEATAVAYIGQPNTRLFGEKSGGYTVGNNGYLLFDGARLILAESTYVDGNGNQHIGGIVPDEVVKTDLQVYGTTDDPVIQAASVWLREQSGCDMATPVP